jgi:hypothetical protein
MVEVPLSLDVPPVTDDEVPEHAAEALRDTIVRPARADFDAAPNLISDLIVHTFAGRGHRPGAGERGPVLGDERLATGKP